jgi:hypothetical protein
MLKRRVQIAASVLPTDRAHSGRDEYSHHPGRTHTAITISACKDALDWFFLPLGRSNTERLSPRFTTSVGSMGEAAGSLSYQNHIKWLQYTQRGELWKRTNPQSSCRRHSPRCHRYHASTLSHWHISPAGSSLEQLQIQRVV